MQQYNTIKAKYPGALLLFRVGDFYETFGEDAVKAAKILGIVLTKRGNGTESETALAGFPHHSLETYLPKLVRAGQRVAICDQLEDPKQTKTIVKRGVTELVTPGVSYNENIVHQKSNNYLASLYTEKSVVGVSFLDISTGEFLVAQGNVGYIDKLLQGFKPTEIILPKKQYKEFLEQFEISDCAVENSEVEKKVELAQPEKVTMKTVVEYFHNHRDVRDELIREIKQVGDLERLISKIGLQKANPREIIQLKRALYAVEKLKEMTNASDTESLKMIAEQLNPCLLIREKIEKTVKAEPPVALNKGNVIEDGVDADLDKLRKVAFGGKDYLLEIQRRESEATGIPSLKIAFNNVFGYYLEVTNTHKDKVPDSWIRKQTLVNAERYITEELKEYEEQILGAEEKIQVIENRIYAELLQDIAAYIKPIQLNAQLIAKLDVLLNFAVIAEKNYYIKPEINNSRVLDIKGGRHPVIEKKLPIGEDYITNDTFLDPETQQIIIITGPNMAGKSALLRQTGLIVLMAQIGSFVPAKEASIGIVDKIFTRVGASDNLSSGESTFMVEMNETASIMNNLSDRSLILLDEIGRGTSTYDGISIAWAIAEYLHGHPSCQAKTLFATHYHELNELCNSMPRIKNYNVSVKEVNNKVIFLRKLVPGGSEHSFGIHVAKLAGMPPKLIGRANDILKRLEQERTGGEKIKDSMRKIQKQAYQLQMFAIDDPVLEKIRDMLNNLDVNTLTPVEALMKLDEIQRLLKN
ncbi:UNVERIFIED_CONTAM: mutS [Trichonephila clavipes]